MESTGPPHDERLQPLLEDFLERVRNGEEPAISEYETAHPELAGQIREVFSAMLFMEGLEADGDDHVGTALSALFRGETKPEQIGPYGILEVLGEGGMGTVYLAEQREPVRRQVALKVIKLGMDSRQVLLRFEAERQALAMMEHDNIAKVFDAGTTERGQPFFVMEHVPGLPLAEYCDQQRLNTKERLRLFQEVCSGVQHAHQKGVIHRDLKPSNIVVTERQGRAVPKIIDFGVAKATDHRLTQATIFTERGFIVGTPEYMSPEQAEMTSADIDTRTDIYSLGVILYELLVGELPFSPSELRRAGLVEIQRIIREDEPPRPSTRVATLARDSELLAKRRKSSVSALLRELRGDLDWIVMKAMAKDRSRRYGNADDLAADLQRHLDNEPVLASPPSVGYRLGKFARGYRVQVVAGALVFLSLVAGAVLFAIENARANAALTDFRRLFAVVRLRDAIEAEGVLYPFWPENEDAMREWLIELAEPLEQELPRLRQALEDLRAKALESAGTEIHPVNATDSVIRDQFLLDTMATLLVDLQGFVETGELARVREGLDWIEFLENSTSVHAARWGEARQAIRQADGIVASELYRSEPPLDLLPQVGLVPIGMNPKTKLWEFYHLRSAADPSVIPEHDENGSIEVTPETGIIFVLLPGGRFTMGAQNEDPLGPNYDPQAEENEELREVEQEPWFLARHEMTQAQWERLSGGETPSRYTGDYREERLEVTVTRSHPVESVSWDMSHQLLTRHGLALPSEALWEYACRAGSTTPWSTGTEGTSLEGYANILDRTGAASQLQWGTPEDFDDGFVIHSPVESFLPNAFGLFDMYGNLWEWCSDQSDSSTRPQRGGCYHLRARNARSANRNFIQPTFRSDSLGVRPAREIL